MHDWIVADALTLGGGLLLLLGGSAALTARLRKRSEIARIVVEVVSISLLGAAVFAIPCYLQGQALAALPLRRAGNFQGIFPIPNFVGGWAHAYAALGHDRLPAAWVGFGLGNAAGVGLGLAVQHRDRPRGNEAFGILYQASLPVLVFILILLLGQFDAYPAFGAGSVYTGPAIGMLSSMTSSWSSIGPEIAQQLAASVASQTAFGAVVGAAAGLVIAYSAGVVVDFLGGFVALATSRARLALPGFRGPLPRLRSEGSSAPSSSSDNLDDLALRVSLYSAVFTPVAVWLAVLVGVMIAVFAGFVHHWGDNDGKMWPLFVFLGHVLNILYLVLCVVLVAIGVVVLGTIHALASAIVNTGQALKSALGDTRFGFDWYSLVGGTLLGFVLGFGTQVPVLGWLVQLVGGGGWYSVLFGVALGVLLGAGPALKRAIDVIPERVVIVAGGILAVGGAALLVRALI